MDVATEVLEAERRIRRHVRETPVERSRVLGSDAGEVFLKLENFQRTGSFKIRGALNKILSLAPGDLERGVVAASSGNHGAGVALALRVAGGRGIVFAPEGAASHKLAAIRGLGVEVRLHGDDCAATEVFARGFAEERGMTYVSPYNDPAIVAGQGTIGVELARQLEGMDTIFVALGGGGLIAGLGGYLKSLDPAIEVVGCSPERSAVMAESLRAGKILELRPSPTLSDGTAGGVEPGSITFELCRRIVDRCVTVSEEEIAGAMRLVLGDHHMLIEGAAGVAVAAFLRERLGHAGRRTVVLLCGANVGPETLKRVL